VLPREVASIVITGAVSRAGWAVAIAILVMNLVVLVDMVGRRSGPVALLIPVLASIGLLALIVLVGLRPSRAKRIVLLVVGGILATVYAYALLAVDPALNGDASHLINRPAFVLVISAVGLRRPAQGLFWGAAGFAVAISSVLLAEMLAGVPFAPGWGPVVAFAIYAAAYLILAGVRRSQASAMPDLQRLEEETRRLALEHQYEQRAAALIHDTVLGDLTAVMNSSGDIDERARARFRADVATLAGASWLRESRDVVRLDENDAALRNGMVATVSEMQWRGLTVDVTGDPVNAVVRLTPDQISAVHAAVRACLENVLQHAQTGSAEVVLGASGGEATVMIVDQGVGFDPAAVPSDRLGIRSSIVRRIEEHGGSVRIWSSPGAGTSVMLSIPSGEEVVDADS